MPTIAVNFFGTGPLLMSGSLKSASAYHSYSGGPLTLTNANGGGTWTVGSGLPYWASLNASSGVITGTPDILMNMSGWLRGATPGQTYSSPAMTLRDASGGGTWTKGSGAPAWLTLDATTGIFGGSP